MKREPSARKRILRKDVPTFANLPELVTPEEAGAFLRVSQNGVYELLRTGELPSIRFGRLIRIKKSALLGEAS